MPQTLKKNTTSQSILRTIKKKLQGKCTTCGGTLPSHIGTCPVWGEELMRKYDGIDAELVHINDLVESIVKSHKEYRNV